MFSKIVSTFEDLISPSTIAQRVWHKFDDQVNDGISGIDFEALVLHEISKLSDLITKNPPLPFQLDILKRKIAITRNYAYASKLINAVYVFYPWGEGNLDHADLRYSLEEIHYVQKSFEYGKIGEAFDPLMNLIITDPTKLTLPQIALLHIYNGIDIDKNNAPNIVKEYGHNSSEKLIREFNNYQRSSSRTGNPENTKSTINMIERIEIVLPFLSGAPKSMASGELEIVKSHLNT